jgi:hypothetical protein
MGISLLAFLVIDVVRWRIAARSRARSYMQA